MKTDITTYYEHQLCRQIQQRGFRMPQKKGTASVQSEYKTKTSFRARDARSTVSFVLADLQSLPLMFAYVEDI